MGKNSNCRRITRFDLAPGTIVAGKYEIVAQLGTGCEGEVYMLRECDTGIERAGKFFYPHRNPRNRVLNYYARKLHKLRHCPILIQHHTQETMTHMAAPI